MWVGESEKNLQKIFDTYHYNNNVTKRTPILLLNEADALLGKRINIAHSVDQMNNSMQNILLQELERFEGILIATTNLKQNLDQAFDRRFLYKIKFTSPEAEVRRLIINNKLPDIPDYFRIMLAESYMLTGAQLENIKKKYHVHKLLQQEEPDINRIEKWCMEETENAGNSSKIGFKISNNA
jgi:SpoVK/Ycf46/Vps4 family AAA+-type ATPase